MTQLQTTEQNSITVNLIACHDCGEVLPTSDLFKIDDIYYCKDCLERNGYCKCEHCDTIVKENYTLETASGDIICQDCYGEYYFTCDDCDCIYKIRYSNFIESGDRTICDSCYSENYFTCRSCDEVYHIDNMYEYHGDAYCEYCYNDRIPRCSECGDPIDSDDDDDVEYCSHCMPRHVLHKYSYKPDPVFFGEDRFHLGIELEISCQNKLKAIKAFDNDDFERLYLKEDASVTNGFEIVSHPMTLQEHKQYHWEDLCSRLTKYGARGNVANCGIHVHISNTYLSDTERLKLSWFICHHIDQLRLLARRNSCYSEHRSPEQIIAAIKQIQKHKNNSRYEILNWDNPDTVEFRLPQSTLRYPTIMAILEFCDAVVRFVQTGINFLYLQDCWDAFMSWCYEHKYLYLVGYYFWYSFDNGYTEI